MFMFLKYISSLVTVLSRVDCLFIAVTIINDVPILVYEKFFKPFLLEYIEISTIV